MNYRLISFTVVAAATIGFALLDQPTPEEQLQDAIRTTISNATLYQRMDTPRVVPLVYR